METAGDFILASASPRRKALLAEAGYRFEVIPSDVDESLYPTDNTTSEEHVRILALAKAGAVAENYPDLIVMGSDTVVDLDGHIIGKADDAAHAEKIIRRLFSREHKVITGVALVGVERNLEIVEADTTVVVPRMLTEEQIRRHIDSGAWEGKAGAYGIQQSGDAFVERVEGSFTNVMGLPMELIRRLLAQLDIYPHT